MFKSAACGQSCTWAKQLKLAHLAPYPPCFTRYCRLSVDAAGRVTNSPFLAKVPNRFDR
ncbi:MAG: hypothetical protein SGJ20_14285 [Planctomycetota bacterium]|nr:hypothetical protein [Planctomycetota bacterium]